MKLIARIVLFVMLFPINSHGAMPEKFVGLWATNDSVYVGEIFLGGLALYIGESGEAFVLTGPTPKPTCFELSCAKVAAMRARIEIGEDKKSVLFASKDMSGKLVSGVGFVYEAASNSLRGEGLMWENKTLFRRTSVVSVEVMEELSDAISPLERDLPTGFVTYIVPSRAMDPTLKAQQIILVDTSLYKKYLPSRGDIVAYESTKSNRDIFIHRIVALPGDTVEIRNGVLLIGGRPIEEPYVSLGRATAYYSKDMQSLLVPSDAVFVLG
jgi:hypothetical protein